VSDILQVHPARSSRLDQLRFKLREFLFAESRIL